MFSSWASPTITSAVATATGSSFCCMFVLCVVGGNGAAGKPTSVAAWLVACASVEGSVAAAGITGMGPVITIVIAMGLVMVEAHSCSDQPPEPCAWHCASIHAHAAASAATALRSRNAG